MVFFPLAAVFVGVVVYRRIRRRRARKRAIKLLAASNCTVRSPVAVDAREKSFPEDEVIIIGRESTSGRPSSLPPYSTPSPSPYVPSEGPPHLTAPGFDYPGTYSRSKPPPYSAAALNIQNS